MEAPSDPPPGAEHLELLNSLGEHRTWFWRLLYKGGAFDVVPWPLQHVVAYVSSRRPGGPIQLYGSLWSTAALAAAAAYLWSSHNLSKEVVFAGDAAKALLAGAFLLGTMLSVSVALPGAAVLRSLLRRPSGALSFVAPYAWAFLWGISSAMLLMFLRPIQEFGGNNAWHAAIVLAIYGWAMELNALLHTVRMYTLGLLKWGVDEARKAAADAAAEEEAETAEAVDVQCDVPPQTRIANDIESAAAGEDRASARANFDVADDDASHDDDEQEESSSPRLRRP